MLSESPGHGELLLSYHQRNPWAHFTSFFRTHFKWKIFLLEKNIYCKMSGLTHLPQYGMFSNFFFSKMCIFIEWKELWLHCSRTFILEQTFQLQILSDSICSPDSTFNYTQRTKNIQLFPPVILIIHLKFVAVLWTNSPKNTDWCPRAQKTKMHIKGSREGQPLTI